MADAVGCELPLVSTSQLTTFQPAQESSASQNELNFACLKTCVKLLDRLELRPLDTSSAGDDSAHVVARLFNKYSTMLLDGIKLIQSDIPV